VVPAQALALRVALRCYRIPFSTNVERVALAAGYKRLAVEWVDVDPADRSLVEAASGQPLVPVLEADGLVFADSPRILEWLEERYPEPPLLPADPARRAEVRIFCDWFNRVWKVWPNAIEAGEAGPDAHLAEMRAAVDRFEALLAGRDHLFGEFGLADVTAFPFLKYASLGLPPGDDELFHRILAESTPLAAGSPLHGWIARVDARPRG
jgi:glutathione S-transferase